MALEVSNCAVLVLLHARKARQCVQHHAVEMELIDKRLGKTSTLYCPNVIIEKCYNNMKTNII